MMEAVNADFDGTVSIYGIHLERSGDEFAGNLAADVLLESVNQGLLADAESTLVVIELHIIREIVSEIRQVAGVVHIEDRGIQRRNGAEEFVGGRCGLRRLRLGECAGKREKRDEQQHSSKGGEWFHRNLPFVECTFA